MLSFTLVFFCFRVFCYDYVKNRKRKKTVHTHNSYNLCAKNQRNANVYCISASTKVNLHQQLSHERYKFTFGNNRKSSLKRKRKYQTEKQRAHFQLVVKSEEKFFFSSKQTKYSELTRFLVF